MPGQGVSGNLSSIVDPREIEREREITVDGAKQTIAEPDAAHGLITSRNFGGTHKWRACYVSDGTGHAMLYTMSNRAIAAGMSPACRTTS